MSRTILIIAPYLPVPANFGGALRIFHFIRNLSREHNVILLAPGDERELLAAWNLHEICDVTLVPARTTARKPADRRKRIAQLESGFSNRSFLEASSYNPQMQAVLNRLFMTRTIDLVQYEFPESGLYMPPRPIPTVFDAHNIEHELLQRVAKTSTSTLKRAYNFAESRKVTRLEIDAWNRAAICVATSERDAGRMRQATSTPVEVVPNGVDLETFGQAQHAPRLPHHVVFSGAMRHQPNADGALWYLRQVHPLIQQSIPDTQVTIVGADPPANIRSLASSSVSVTGTVEAVVPFIGSAQVVVVPLWSGGGTRLKILEAFAAGRPVVSTTIGAEGIDARDGEHLLLADTPQAFAAAVMRLFNDDALASRLGAAGRKLAEERYGWEGVSQRLIHVHNLALGTRS